jgi:Branched-chain amino acid aminotransferase/4-amino-4-deoxychorismate lyase
MNQFMLYNGELRPATQAIAAASNRGLRYGDGVFETIKMVNGHMPLLSLHIDRLTHGLKTLQIPLPPLHSLEKDIIGLCQKNGITGAARVRLMVYRGNGSLYAADTTLPHMVIQIDPLAPAYLSLNERGWRIDILPGVQKSCDVLANLKSNNYLPYIMAALHAQRHELDDCLVLNTYNRICDAGIANVFWVQAGCIYTPPLSEGGVAGVMRRYLLQQKEFECREELCTEEQLLEAEEVFLTNALYGVRWVKGFRGRVYECRIARKVYNLMP